MGNGSEGTTVHDAVTPSTDSLNAGHVGAGEEVVAIVGFSLRFPEGLDTSHSLWDALMMKRNTASTIPESRMSLSAMYHPDPDRRGQVAVSHGHFLNQDLASFDAPLFDVSTTDAANMDPQQRLLLETTFTALENAGLPLDKVSGSNASVFPGSFSHDWMHLAYKDAEQSSTTTALGVQPNFNANRLSWFFNLHGNSANVDTACSSGLVCVDLGCQSLQNGNANLSIVTGSNIMLSPDNMHALTNLNMLSPDGQSFSFDHRANGYSRGEGIGVLILKRLSDAIRDCDTVRGIIRGTGCSQNGRTSSITLTDQSAQEALIRDTYCRAGLSMEPTRFVEAHGTGTQVGDPVEAKAFGSVFRTVRSSDDPLYIGAIKSNFGHLEGASGIAGIIKTLLCLEKAVIPPNTNFQQVNPKIDTGFLRIKFPTTAIPWPKEGLRRASINSFGNGGTNAHVILDDVFHYLQARGLAANHITVADCSRPPCLDIAPQSHFLQQKRSEQQPKLLVFSSRDMNGTIRMAQKYEDFYRQVLVKQDHDPAYLDRLAYTLFIRRSNLQWRSYAIVRSLGDLPSLTTILSKPQKAVKGAEIAFCFAGQGSQWSGMAKELMSYPIFHDSLLRSESYLQELGCVWPLQQTVFCDPGSILSSAEISQPACTAIQLAMVDLLAFLGVRPSAVIGHSSGEIAAAYCSGAISHAAALKIAFHRGRLAADVVRAQKVKGAMMAVGLSQDAAQLYLDHFQTTFEAADLVVACVNSGNNVTFSGSEKDILLLSDLLHKDGIFSKRLDVDIAYHSSHTFAMAGQYQTCLGSIEPAYLSGATVPMYSTVSGTRVDHTRLTEADYWVQNLTSQVKFSQALKAMLAGSSRKTRKKLDLSHRTQFRVDAIVEVSPHATLKRFVLDTILQDLPGSSIRYIPTLIRDQPADEAFMETAGELNALGYPVDLIKVNHVESKPSSHFTLPDLPEYSFDHTQQYWSESRLSKRYRTSEQGKIDLLGKPVLDWNDMEPKWRNFLRVGEMPWIEDHIVDGRLLYPAAGMIVMAIEAADQLCANAAGSLGFELKELLFRRPLSVPRDLGGIETQLSIRRASDDTKPLSSWSQWRLFAYGNDQWSEICTGMIRVKYQLPINEVDSLMNQESDLVKRLADCAILEGSCRQHVNVQFFYDGMQQCGLAYGPSFRRFRGGRHGAGRRTVATVSPYQWPRIQYPQPHIVHPVTLDCLFHSAFVPLVDAPGSNYATRIPASLDNIFISKDGLSHEADLELTEYARIIPQNQRSYVVDAFVLAPARDKILFEFSGLRITEVAGNGKARQRQGPPETQMVYHIERFPDPTFLNDHGLQRVSQIPGSDHWSGLAVFLDLLARKTTALKILVANVQSMQALSSLLNRIGSMHHNISHRDNMDYDVSIHVMTDMQDTFVGSATTTGPSGPITFVPTSCEYEPGTFDVAIYMAPTEHRQSSIQAVQKQIKIGGTLICYPTIDQASITTSRADQDDVLNDTGYVYQGIITDRQSQDTLDSPFSVQIYRHAAPAEQVVRQQRVSLVHNSTSKKQLHFARQINDFLSAQAFDLVDLLPFDELSPTTKYDQSTYVILLEVDKPLLLNMDRATYLVLQNFLVSVDSIVWVNKAGGFEPETPESALASGLLRALRTERQHLQCSTISYEGDDQLSDAQLYSLTKVIARNHGPATSEPEDFEFVEIEGKLTIPRVAKRPGLMQSLARECEAQHVIESGVRDAAPFKIGLGAPGVLSSLHFHEDQDFARPLAPDEIEVAVRAVGLNFRDCLTTLGRLENSGIGQECAGVVVRSGSESGFRIGDTVIVLLTGVFKSHVRCKTSSAFEIPSSMPFTTAASFAAQFGTAWICLHRIARLQSGETVLIHIGASGTGQAAIQLAMQIGATVYTTVGSRMKKQLIMDNYAIPEERIFYSRDPGFAGGIKRATAGRGVDVILNSLSDESLYASWECIAPCGRFVEIGKKDIMSNSKLPMLAFQKNASFHAFDGFVWFRERSAEARADIQHLIRMVENGIIKPPQPLHIRDIAEVQDVFKTMQSGNEAGKFVVRILPESKVQVTCTRRARYMLDSGATYIVAGGLGGIGRATARWLVSRGVMHLILLSRKGPRTEAAHELLRELHDKSVAVATPACDITDQRKLKQVLDDLAKSMPRIKGCVQASLIAKDRLFVEMTFDEWDAATGCKVAGSWNLHQLLPSNLDFFLMLSSASGLAGIKGQANYDAANTYQDALARHRVAAGQKAAVFDLGAMLDDGILAENRTLLSRVLAYGSLGGISRQTYHALLDHYCDPALPILSPTECQVAIGLGKGGAGAGGLEGVNYSRQPMLWPLERGGTRGTDAAGDDDRELDCRSQVATSTSLEDAAQIITRAIVEKLGQSLVSLQDESIDTDVPLQAQGVDSLLATELGNWIAREFSADVAVFETQGAASLSSLGMVVAGRSTIRHPARSNFKG